MLHKFAIIIPTAAAWVDAASIGQVGVPVNRWAVDRIVAEAGGATQTNVFGIWRGPLGIVAEDGYRFDFASTHDLTEFVRSLAQFLVSNTHEMCVYVEHGDGAEII
ncbi:hypothetical protein [Caulobacter phage Cd1]|uniref:Uncharacterized protein n=1 Tax=Caulobacter phage Cd1 TaxID=718008 RepID=F1ADN9_9CAUD|nr:hypothetical protein [Caulobacter phage Cd1]